MDSFKIGTKTIGDNCPCFVIAEAGSNHDGSLSAAKKLIDIAAEAGADAIKFQMFKAENLVLRTDPDFDLIKSIEFNRDWLAELKSYSHDRGLIFIMTPFDMEAVDQLENVNVEAYKVASGDITYFSLLERIAQTTKPIIIASGKSTIEDVREAMECLSLAGAKNIAVLHCVACYPAKPEEMNLKVIRTYKEKLKVPIGLSDHSTSTIIPALAVSLGANIVEKHFTIDKNLPGPDHSYALNPDELVLMVKNIRLAEAALGTGEPRPSESEMMRLLTGRRGIYATTNIKVGQKIESKMVCQVRPQVGMSAKYFSSLLGRKAKRDLMENDAIVFPDVE